MPLGGRRDCERQPGIPSVGPAGGVKFAVAFEVQVALHIADGKQKTDLWPDTDDTGLV